MRSEKVNYLMVGALVLAMAGTGFYVLERITGTTGPTHEYYVTYEDVTGLTDGAVVSFEGFPIGKVSDIEPVFQPGNVVYRVELSLRKDWPIPSDSVARLASSGLIAALSVAIDEGQSTTLASPGSELAAREQANLFAVVDEVAADFRALSEEGIRPALQAVTVEIQRVVAEFTALSRDELRPLLASGRARVGQVGGVLDEVQALLVGLREVSTGLSGLLDDDNQAHVSATLANMSEAASRLNQLTADLAVTRSAMDGVLVEAKLLIADNQGGIRNTVTGLEHASTDFQRVSGTLAERIGTITANLDSTARHLSEFARQLREQPGLLFARPARDEEGARR
jgi:phospholipid/cholesterol/gamma-HCH transport system substrate-binding protein